jgi:hypothetical protein
MKEHSDVPQDPYADGIANPIRDTPVDVGTAPAFPPDQEASSSTIGSAEATTESGGQIGAVSTTHDNLSDC